MLCENCNTVIIECAKFCMNCGGEVSANVEKSIEIPENNQEFIIDLDNEGRRYKITVGDYLIAVHGLGEFKEGVVKSVKPGFEELV